MQTVCDQKFFGVFPERVGAPLQTESRIHAMPWHERLLGIQLFLGGLVLSGLMLLAVEMF